MYNFSQGQIFLIFLIIGFFIGILFDLFRALRRVIKTSEIITIIEDIVFMAISGIIIINSLIILNNGQIRFYILLAILFGTSFYMLTISKIFIIIFQNIILFFKKILLFPFFIKNIMKKKKDF